MHEIIKRLWSWVRGDTPTVEFERWTYGEASLEPFLGGERWLRLVGADYRDPDEVQRLRVELRLWLDELAPRACECLAWRDDQRIPLGYETRPDAFLKQFDVLRSQSPWVDLARCRACSQAWYLAVDTRDDDYYLHRLDEGDVRAIVEEGRWPATFDAIEAVWPEGGVPDRAT
jgi:hypothetical protein